MSDKFPFFAAESGTWRTTSPNPHVDLSGTALALGTYPVQTFAAAAADTTLAFDSGQTCTVTIWKDATNFKRYEGAVWTDAATDTLDLSAATLAGTSGSIANGDSVSVVASMPAVLQPGGALGTPASGTLTNCSGLPVEALVDGSGTTFPASPIAGQSFLHTTRGVTYQYIGSAWLPRFASGNVSIAVNASGDGDPWNTGAGGGATTLAAGLAALPPIVSNGNVVVYVRAGTYIGMPLPDIILTAGYTAKFLCDWETISTHTTTASVTSKLYASSVAASVPVSGTPTASSGKNYFLKYGNFVWPVIDNTTTVVTVAPDWAFGADVTFAGATSAPANGSTVTISKPCCFFGTAALDPRSLTQWKISGAEFTATYMVYNVAASYGGCKINTSGTSSFIGGTPIFEAGVVLSSSSGGPALLVQQGVCTLRHNIILGGPGTLTVYRNAAALINGCYIQQTIGASGTSSLAVSSGGKAVRGGATAAQGIWVRDPVPSGGYGIVATNGGGTEAVIGGTNYPTESKGNSADAATFGFIQ